MTNDLTTGKPLKQITLFSIPLIINTLLDQFYTLADTAIVGRILGVNALAAVGSTGCLVYLIGGFVGGIAGGCSMVTAQYVGAGNQREVRKSFAMSIVFLAAIIVFITILACSCTKQLLELIHTPEEHMRDAYTYLIIIFAGLFASGTLSYLVAVIRAVGDSRTPLIFLLASSIVNIILDIVFTGCFHMGVGGAALATVSAQIMAALMCAAYIMKKITVLHLEKEDFRLDRNMLRIVIKMGLPMGFLTSIIAIGTIITQTVSNAFGTVAMAAIVAGCRINNFCAATINAVGSAVAVYSAQNFGAGKIDRIKTGVRQVHILSQVWTIASTIVMIFMGKFLLGIIIGGENEEIMQYSYMYLLVNSFLGVFLAPVVIYKNVLQAMGYAAVPTASGFIEVVFRAVAALGLSVQFGFLGVCLASPAAWLGALIPIITDYIIVIRRLSKKNTADLNV